MAGTRGPQHCACCGASGAERRGGTQLIDCAREERRVSVAEKRKKIVGHGCQFSQRVQERFLSSVRVGWPEHCHMARQPKRWTLRHLVRSGNQRRAARDTHSSRLLYCRLLRILVLFLTCRHICAVPPPLPGRRPGRDAPLTRRCLFVWLDSPPSVEDVSMGALCQPAVAP